MIEFESPLIEEKSFPILTWNVDVVNAGLGFKTFDIVITIVLIAKSVVIKLLIIRVCELILINTGEIDGYPSINILSRWG